MRELHDQLSRYVQHAAAGGEVVVTIRGRRVARLSAVSPDDALADLRLAGSCRSPSVRGLRAQVVERGRAREHRSTVSDLQAACGAMVLIGVDWALARQAGDIAQQHGLRGYDALYLATALASDAADLVFVTWDRELARATTKSGVAVAPG